MLVVHAVGRLAGRDFEDSIGDGLAHRAGCIEHVWKSRLCPSDPSNYRRRVEIPWDGMPERATKILRDYLSRRITEAAMPQRLGE